MSGRRGFGSIRQLPSGRWQARYRSPTGERITGGRTFNSRRDAATYLSTVEADLVRGSWRAPTQVTTTVLEYAELWIAQRTGNKRTTQHNQRSLLRLHIAPTIGTRRLVDVDPPMVREWHTTLLASLAAAAEARHARLVAAGKTPSVATKRDGRTTAAHAYRLLRAVYNQAVDDELVRRNPCRIPRAATVRSAERPTASVSEVAALVAATPPHYRALLLLLAFSGARIGEVAALRIRDLDLSTYAPSLHVDERVYRLPGGWDFDVPKSEAGVRTVALPAAVMPVLHHHLAVHRAGAGPDDLVFATRRGNPVGTSFRRAWDAARHAAGRPDLRLHDLRHTGQTLAALAGATERELMARMGHSTTAASRLYSHTTAEHGRAVADALSTLISDPTVVPLRPIVRRRTG